MKPVTLAGLVAAGFDLPATIVSIKAVGPQRILTDRFGGANSPRLVPELWAKIQASGVVFIRDDGWSLGAEPSLALVAYNEWDKEWLGAIPFPAGEYLPIDDYLAAYPLKPTPKIVTLSDERSKTISRMAFDGTTLQLTFRGGGKTYEYKGFTAELWDECQASPRPGTWLRASRVIVGRGQPTDYPFRPLTLATDEVWA